MEQDFSITYRIILYDCGLGKAVGLQSQKIALPVVTFVQINVEDTIIKYVRPGFAGIRLFCHFNYFKPVCHSIRKEETDDEVCTDV